jgi:hypothetical protein
MKRIGSTVEVKTPQGSQFDGQHGKVIKHLDGDAVGVRIDGSQAVLMFSENELVTVTNAPGTLVHLGGKAGR